MNSFSSLGLCTPILRALKHEGYTEPTPIQSGTITAALEGRDVLGCAQTGTGKTAAFALPIIQQLHTAPKPKPVRGPVLPRALVLSPTRELASQIDASFATYGYHTKVAHTVIFGGVSQFRQERALARGVDVLVATPGRLIDLMEQGIVNLSQVRLLVLDEADRMLDMGFIQPIRRIASAIKSDRQTLLFSATMPREIMRLADSLLNDPIKVSLAPVASTTQLIEQSVYMVQHTHKASLLQHLLEDSQIERALVFTRTKHGADRLRKQLSHSGVSSDTIHGNKSQNQRERALEGFRSGRSRVLVATDVAARGLDVDGITHVFNFDLPNEPEAYVHRIGRTGRAGATGIAISFCDSTERRCLRDIERLTRTRIDASALPSGLKKIDRKPTERADSQQSPQRSERRLPKHDDRPAPRNRRNSASKRGRASSRKPSNRSSGPGIRKSGASRGKTKRSARAGARS